jgi:hypothetical protein
MTEDGPIMVELNIPGETMLNRKDSTIEIITMAADIIKETNTNFCSITNILLRIIPDMSDLIQTNQIIFTKIINRKLLTNKNVQTAYLQDVAMLNQFVSYVTK